MPGIEKKTHRQCSASQLYVLRLGSIVFPQSPMNLQAETNEQKSNTDCLACSKCSMLICQIIGCLVSLVLHMRKLAKRSMKTRKEKAWGKTLANLSQVITSGRQLQWVVDIQTRLNQPRSHHAKKRDVPSCLWRSRPVSGVRHCCSVCVTWHAEPF